MRIELLNGREGFPSSFTLNRLNLAPVANAGGPYSVGEGRSVGLTGSGSDPDIHPLTYTGDLDNDVNFETAGQNPIFSAAGRNGPDSQTVVLEVCDDEGLCGADSTTVNIDVTASSRASQSSVDAIDAKLDALDTSNLDVAVSSRAT